MRHYHKGKYKLSNPSKYKGDRDNIVFRSSWELKMFRWCDMNKNVLKWNSEEVIIPYISPLDNKKHRYFIDIYIEFIDKDGVINKIIIEIKPKKQTKPPSKRSKRYMEEMKTYITNQTKWKYASKWAERRGMKFMVLTENELNIKA